MKQQLINEVLKLWSEDLSLGITKNIKEVIKNLKKEVKDLIIKNSMVISDDETIILSEVHRMVMSYNAITEMLESLADDVLQDAAGWCASCVSAPCRCYESTRELQEMEKYK